MDFTRSPGAPPGTDTTDRPPSPPWRRYVALGDSFTEGLWDVPDGDPPLRAELAPPDLRLRGWADLLAGHLSERIDDGEPLHYANLAVRGRLLGPILTEQVPVALELGGDLVSLIGGGNDMLRPTADPDAMALALERAVVRLRESGADVLLATGWDSRDSPIVRRTRGRTALFNAHVWSIARRNGAFVLDLWGMRALHDWRMWSADRIHLVSEGHRRVAQAALESLGQPAEPGWDDPLAPEPPLPRVAQVREDVEWFRTHAYPWATRRLRRRSSGDRRLPKRPALGPLT